MQLTKRGPRANRLLAGLPHKDLQHLLASCESIDLTFAEVVSLSGDRIRHVYFPTGSIISMVAPVDGYAGLEVGMVGNEGMFGVGLLLGVDVSPLHALVQGAGPALRIHAKRFRRELAENPALRRGLNRYLYVLMSQLAQTAACTRFHLVEARLARWLSMTRDRVRSDEFYLTQEFLSHMLGVRRVGVTKAASSLQERKLIAYTRGMITVLDRSALEAAACGCYLADKTTYARNLG
ncbi:MAG TPA: Crp/Fnr family transcriptional regulator [Burkholderiales bacterium]|nr:Crp/Fnr family transcriptional regulator [Burkholderiales bacterium]